MCPPRGHIPSIYIIGPQCTGKTTLVNALYKHFTTDNPDRSIPPPAIISEVARTVLREHHFTARDVRDPVRSLKLQKLILQAQAKAERDILANLQNTNDTKWFISDRSGADPIAYALRYVGRDAAKESLVSAATGEWTRELKPRMQQSLVVICEAGLEAASWLKDDGVRLMPTNLEEWKRLNGVFCGLLKEEEVPYVLLPAMLGKLEDRVEFVVTRWREKWESIE
jgi:Type IV secretory pathway, VirB11 components, and related ATPases involved in archaeal flagella biosynthesis